MSSTKLTFDLSTLDLSAGTYNVKVLPKGDGVTYRDADLAECVAVSYAKPYSITPTLTNVTAAAGNPTEILPNGTATLTFTADTDYTLPDSVNVTGATGSWTKATGTLVLTNPTANVTFAIAGEQESAMPVKGQIITMDLGAPTPDAGLANQYRVLSVEGNVAYVVAMFDASTSCMFNSGSSCLAEGTQVLVSLDGQTRNIEDLKQDDVVISLNKDTGEYYEALVKSVITNEVSMNMAHITTEGGKALTLTQNHPVLTTDGWKSIYNDEYDKLAVGDTLVCVDGEDKIASIELYAQEATKTYTLDVVDKDERNEDFDRDDNFVANGVVVHNAIKPPPIEPTMGSNVYSGGELDTYLNSTWLSNLSATAKSAIQDSTITQYQYPSGTYDATTHASYADYANRSAKATGLTRKVYAMDVDDIEKYFGATDTGGTLVPGTFSPADIWTLFWNTDTQPANYTSPWLRSANSGATDLAFYVFGYYGIVNYDFAFYALAARPAFKINLAEVTWS